MLKKGIYISIVIVLLLAINSLAHSIYDLWHKQDLLTNAQKELELEKLKNTKLKAELSYSQSQQFVDEAARNKLFLVKPGEQQVLISKELTATSEGRKKEEKKDNWQKWFEFFF